MLKKLIRLSIITTIGLYAATPMEIEKVKKEFEALPGFKNFNTKVLDIRDIGDSWYVIKGQQETKQGMRSFDAFSNKKTIVFGSGFDLETGKNLNIKTDFSRFNENATYTVGNGKEVFYLITDPECPYCKQLEEKISILKDKATIHVFMTPDIIPSHLAAKGMMYYIQSMPKELRASESHSLMTEKDTSIVLKKIDKFNISMYQNLLPLVSNPKAGRLISSYVADLEKAFNVKLDNNDLLSSFLNEKIKALSTTDLSMLEREYKDTKNILDMYFKANGTPTVFAADGKKLENQFEMFAITKAYDLEKIKQLASNKELSITAGKIGAKKLYYFIGTQCPACKNDFKNKEEIDKLLKDYEVHFILGQAGSNPELAEKDIEFIYSIKDENEKFKVFRSLMESDTLIQAQPNSATTDYRAKMAEQNGTYTNDYKMKIAEYLGRDLMMTFVLETPTIIDENGNKIK